MDTAIVIFITFPIVTFLAFEALYFSLPMFRNSIEQQHAVQYLAQQLGVTTETVFHLTAVLVAITWFISIPVVVIATLRKD